MPRKYLVYKNNEGEGALVNHPAQQNEYAEQGDTTKPKKHLRGEWLRFGPSSNGCLRKIAGEVDAGLTDFAVAFSGQTEGADSMGASVLPPIIKFKHLSLNAGRLKFLGKNYTQVNTGDIELPEKYERVKIFIARADFVTKLRA